MALYLLSDVTLDFSKAMLFVCNFSFKWRRDFCYGRPSRPSRSALICPFPTFYFRGDSHRPLQFNSGQSPFPNLLVPNPGIPTAWNGVGSSG